MNSKKFKFPSELRFDLISKDWVVVASGRGKRPEMFRKEKRAEIKISPRECPFCNVGIQEKPLLIYSRGKKVPFSKNWSTIVVPNKFPAFLPQPKFEKEVDEDKSSSSPTELPLMEAKVKMGTKSPSPFAIARVVEGNLYQTMPAVGFCELVATRDHEKSLALLSENNAKEVFDSYQERYLELMKKRFVNYVSIFHNEGAEAGASQPHPHSQIITSPLIDVDLRNALLNSKKYFKKTGKCIYCRMNDWEKKNKKRIVFENKDFLAICPFASKAAFEIIISPKRHLPYFEKITEKEKWRLAEAFQVALKKLYKALNDPAYNFYLHTAPCDGKKYPFYHWHWTILPKTSTWAGFEIGTRMEISTIEPEKAAEYLRKQK